MYRTAIMTRIYHAISNPHTHKAFLLLFMPVTEHCKLESGAAVDVSISILFVLAVN